MRRALAVAVFRGQTLARLYAVECHQEGLRLVETPDDLVETLFDGGQARRDCGVVRACDTAAVSWGVVHGGAFPLTARWPRDLR